MNRKNNEIKIAKKRDGFKCRRCGSGDKTVGHHIIELINGGPDHHENIITLCEECHFGWHHRCQGWVSFELFMQDDSRLNVTGFVALGQVAREEMKKKGMYIGGGVPFGFAVDPDGALIAIDAEQDVIRHIVSMRQSGKTFRVIREWVMECHGRALSLAAIHRIVRDHTPQGSEDD